MKEEIEIQKEEKFIKVSKKTKASLTIAGNLAQIQINTMIGHQPAIRRINRNEYQYLRNSGSHIAGEIAEYNHYATTRKDNYSNILRTINKLSWLINANFLGERDELFITLTYADNMTDTTKLYNDVNNFMRNFRKNQGLTKDDIRYITVIEPQERGAWHAHILIKNLKWLSKTKQWFIPFQAINKMWRHGSTDITRLATVDNVGSYLSSYLSNLHDKKGARLHMYPKGIRIYRTSRNCKKPIKVQTTTATAIEKLRKYYNLKWLPEPTWASSIKIKINEKIEIINSKINFNFKRNPGTKFLAEDYIYDWNEFATEEEVRIKLEKTKDRALLACKTALRRRQHKQEHIENELRRVLVTNGFFNFNVIDDDYSCDRKE